MGILTVVCYEQGGLFEYFSTLGSQAGCSFVKALYCISFLCQSRFPVAVLCQTMTPGFLQVAWRRALPRALGPHCQPLNNLRGPTCTASSTHLVLLTLTFSSPPLSSPCFLYLALISPPSSVFSYRPPPACPPPPCFPLSTPPFLFVSLLPSSLCPTVQVRRGSVRHFLCKPQVQTTPCEGISATTDSDAL